VKLLRTIRLDASDAFVFERAATPGEWAVSGAFAFTQVDVTELAGKPRAAFRSGFLGIDTLGWSTLAEVGEASAAEREAAIERLAQQLLERFGAPNLACARAAATEEIDFSAALSDHPKGMLVAVSRRWEDGAIREAFRTLTPSIGPKPLRAYAFLEVVGEDADEEVDLTALGEDSGPTMGQKIDQKIGQKIGEKIDQEMAPNIGQDIGANAGQETGQETGHETEQETEQTTGQDTGQDTETGRHRRRGDRN